MSVLHRLGRVATCAAAISIVLSAVGARAQESNAPRRDNLVEVGASAGLLYRQLRYNDDLYGFLRDYQLRDAAVFGGYVVAYPLAVAYDDSLLGRLGVEARYSQMQEVNSTRSDGAQFPTRSHEFVAGLRFRLLGRSLRQRGFDVSAGLGFAQHVFRVRSSVALPNLDNRAALPSVRYRSIRVDVGGRGPRDAGFFIAGHLGLRIVVDAGDIDGADWFPRARRAGIEAGARIGYVLPKDIELSAGFESRRYFFSVNPEPGDPFIVGGVLDRYVTADARIAWRY